MKTLITTIMLCLSAVLFSQTDSLTIKMQQTAQAILKEKKSVDSIQSLKEKEIRKQIRLLSQLNEKIDRLKKEAKYSRSQAPVVLQFDQAVKAALKPRTEVVYWEEVRRKWTGRLFSRDDTRIRLFRFEDGRKVYLN